MAFITFRSTMRVKSAVFWIIAWPIIWVLLSAFVFMPPQHGVSISMAIIETPGSHEFVKALTSNVSNAKASIVKVSDCCYPCRPLAEKLVRLKRFDVVVVPQCFADNASAKGLSVYVKIFVKASSPSNEYLYVGIAMENVEKFMVSESISRIFALAPKLTKCLGPNAISKVLGAAYPVIPQIEEVKPSQTWGRPQALGVYVLGAVGYSALISAVTAGAGIFAYRKEGGMLRRLLSTPARLTSVAIADLISSMMITAVACVITVAIGMAVGAKIALDPAYLGTWIGIACIAMGVVDGYLLGLLLALGVRDAKGATGISVVVTLMLVFTTGIWFPPKEWLPLPLRIFASWFPISIPFDIAKQLLVWKAPVELMTSEIAKLIALSMAMLTIVSAVYWKRFERIAHRVLT